MKILYKNSTYETSCELTIKKMLSDGGVVIQPEEESDKSSDILEERPRRTRRRNRVSE